MKCAEGPDDKARHGPRIAREQRTIEAMVRLYCRGHHQGRRGALCESCRELLDYATCRLDRCPFGEAKSACVDCPIHCYKPAMRERVKQVMRFAGPRMLLWHPVLAVRHLFDGRRSGLNEALSPDTPD